MVGCLNLAFLASVSASLPLCSIPASCHLPLCLPALWSQVLWSLPTLGPSLSPLQFFFKAHCYAVSEQVERCWSTFHRVLPDAERWEGLKSGHWGVEAALWSATTHFLLQFMQSCYHWVIVASFSCSDLFTCHLFCQFSVFPSFRLFTEHLKEEFWRIHENWSDGRSSESGDNLDLQVMMSWCHDNDDDDDDDDAVMSVAV